jgi:hypothetical protein
MHSPSITYQGHNEPFELQLSRGQLIGHTLVNIQGYNASIPTTFTAAWELANTTPYVFPSAAVTMAFTSTVAETLTVQVFGLDDTYAIKTATVTFNNSTTGTVTTGTATFFRINAIQVSKGVNAGTVSVTNGGVTYAQIAVGLGRSQASIYTVPANYAFYLLRAQAFTTNNGTQFCTYRVASRTFVDGVSTEVDVLTAPFTQTYMSTRVVPREYAAKTDVQWQLKQSNAAPGSIQLEGILIKVNP